MGLRAGMFKIPISFQKVKSLDHMEDLSSLRNLRAISPEWLHQFAFPPIAHQGSLFSTSCQLVLSLVFLRLD